MLQFYNFMEYKPHFYLPKNLRKRIQKAKNTQKMIIFHKFEYSSLLTLVTIQIRIRWTRSYMWHSYDFIQLQYKPLLYLPKNLGKRTQTAKNTKKIIFQCRPLPQSKIKTIGYAIISHILFVSRNLNTNHSMNCPEILRKGPKRLKIVTVISTVF